MKMAVMDLSYNNTSSYVFEFYLLPVIGRCVNCFSDGSRVCAPQIHVRFLRQYEV